jgi:hypothetical protein
MNITVIELLNMIDSAQDENTEVFINNNGYDLLDFTLEEYYTSHIKESYDNILSQKINSFLFDDESITIEL